MNTCELLKHHLLKHGRKTIQRHEKLDEHLRECTACQRLVESWERIPGLLEALPEREPSDALLHSTAQLIAGSNQKLASKVRPVPRLATSLASAAVLLAAVGLSRQLIDNEFPSLSGPAFKEEYENAYRKQTESLRRSRELGDTQPGAGPADPYAENLHAGDGVATIGGGYAGQYPVEGDRTGELTVGNGRIETGLPEEEAEQVAGTPAPASQSQRAPAETRAAGIDLVRNNEKKNDEVGQKVARLSLVNEPLKISGAGQLEQSPASKPVTQFGFETGARLDESERQRLLKGEGFQDTADGDDKLVLALSRSELTSQETLDELVDRDGSSLAYREGDSERVQGWLSADKRMKNKLSAPQSKSVAELAEDSSSRIDFFRYDEASEALHFQPAQGYWANTHVPGDPAIRLLKARLAAWDRSGSEQLLRLEQDVRPVPQPFDAPADNALALSLMSDANAVEGATRMRLQVGIRGIEHRRGQRPAMNVGVVIDLPADADDDTRIATRALLDAVLASKQSGDRFSLVMNGPGGLVVPPDEFRFGPLQLARQAIAGNGQADPVEGQDLGKAILTASELVRQTDDPSLPLGSSSILLLSANSLGDIDQLSTLIHTQAADGITLSVVPLGSRPNSNGVEQLVLAGLGNRRILESPEQARQLIEAELHSSSRAVARAARLSIRLEPGVRLIDVVGTERLDSMRSQRVRDIENSMDRRLSTNLGIQADRGEDEEGIQIVIPSIFSGDDVTVLIDVLVDRPGDIASVSLRYKDLVFSRNGNLRGQLSLPAGELERGPAEHAVTKNLLAHHFSAAFGQAADALGRHQPADAVAILGAMRGEIAALRNRIPVFKHDPDLLRDEQILERYSAVLETSGAHQPELADSLRYAAWAKAHRPPAEWK